MTLTEEQLEEIREMSRTLDAIAASREEEEERKRREAEEAEEAAWNYAYEQALAGRRFTDAETAERVRGIVKEGLPKVPDARVLAAYLNSILAREGTHTTPPRGTVPGADSGSVSGWPGNPRKLFERFTR